MHNQYTDLLINLPEENVQQIVEVDEQTIHIQIVPTSHKQDYPICRSDRSVIRKGSNKIRKIRHTDAFGKIIYETLLDILPGRKLEELRDYVKKHPEFLALHPEPGALRPRTSG